MLLQIGGVLGAAAWLNALPDRTDVTGGGHGYLVSGTIAVVRLVRAGA